MTEYLIVTALFAVSAALAVTMIGSAMSRYFGLLVACISLPVP